MIKLHKLVTDNGQVLLKDGFVAGENIVDSTGAKYPAGYDARNNLYATDVDHDNTVINLQGNRLEGFTV